jgi:hypothetical protein
MFENNSYLATPKVHGIIKFAFMMIIAQTYLSSCRFYIVWKGCRISSYKQCPFLKNKKSKPNNCAQSVAHISTLIEKENKIASRWKWMDSKWNNELTSLASLQKTSWLLVKLINWPQIFKQNCIVKWCTIFNIQN